MPYCTQLPCICAPNSKIVVLKKKPNSNRLHVLKGNSGHAETPTVTVCGKTNEWLVENEEVYTRRKSYILGTENAERACLACKTWVNNGAPYFHD